MRDPPPPGPFSLVVCRNVLIYYDDPADQLALLRTLLAPLAPGGWLVLGHAERPPEGLPELEAVSRGGALLYRRRGGGPLVLPPGREATPWRPVLRPDLVRPSPPLSAPPDDAPVAAPAPAPAPPPDPTGPLAEAMVCADAGDLERARALLAELVAARPTAGMPRVIMASLAERAGELARARAWLEQATYLAPADAEVRRHAAAVFDRLGLPVEAEAAEALKAALARFAA